MSNSAGDFFDGEKLYSDLVKYASFGVHRTATRGEEDTTNWMADKLDRSGLRVTFEKYPADVFLIDRAELTVGEKEVDCFPLWPPRWTDEKGIIAPLAIAKGGGLTLKGKIVVIEVPPSSGGPSFIQLGSTAEVNDAAAAGALGVVVIAQGPSGEIHAYNTPPNVPRWTIPVALVPKRLAHIIMKGAADGLTAHLTLAGADRHVEARNIIGRIGGGKRLVVVSTPKSGWFTCAGERGSGVAIWLALARWLAARKSDFSYLFDANSGHELGGSGIRHFLGTNAPSPSDVVAWVHLGANIATWRWQQTATGLVKSARPDRYVIHCTDDGVLAAAKKAVVGLPGLEPSVGPGIGEMVGVMQKGYHGFGVNGGNYQYFHTPADTPENASAPELLEPVARALAKAIELIEEAAR